MSLEGWMANLTRRVEKLEQQGAAGKAVSDWKKWAVGVGFMVANAAIALINFYFSRR